MPMRLHMKTMVAFMLLFATIPTPVLSTEVDKDKAVEFTVTTEKGQVLKCYRVRFGHFQLLSGGQTREGRKTSNGPSPHVWGHEAPWKLIQTTTITRCEGDSFGFEFLLPRIGKDDALIIKAVIEAPTKKGPSRRIEEDFKYFSQESNLMRSIRWTFDSKDGRNQDVSSEGKFEFSLYNRGALLVSKTFQVTKETHR
jgi:hypothetical protein